MDDDRYRRTGVKNTLAMKQLRRADMVVTSAGFTAERIVHHSKMDPDLIRVIPLPVSAGFFDPPASPTVERPYVLAMADLRTPDPRKRSKWLLGLADKLARLGLDLRVVGPSFDSGLRDGNILSLGRASDEQLAAWMRGAVCFVSMSAYEGQGLPPLEAMAAGTPVLAFRNTAITETIGVDAFLIQEPGLTEDTEIPGSTVAEIVERVAAFQDSSAAYKRLATERALDYAPEKFFARVQDLARELSA